MHLAFALPVLDDLGLSGWATIRFGFLQDWISAKDLEQIADRRLEIAEDPGGDIALLTSAAALSFADLSGALDALAGDGRSAGGDGVQKIRWLLASLVAARDADLCEEHRLDLVELIQVEFGFPDEMAMLGRYGPSGSSLTLGDQAEAPLARLPSVIDSLRRTLLT